MVNSFIGAWVEMAVASRLLNGTLFRSIIPGSVSRCPVINITTAQTHRAFHTSPSVRVTKILSVDEIFSKKSFHDYLRKKEMEYNSCLDSISAGGQALEDEEGKVKRKNLSVLGPLVQRIKELEEKQQELEDTLDLLKGSGLDLKSSLKCHLICICISFQTQNYMNSQSRRRTTVWKLFKISNCRCERLINISDEINHHVIQTRSRQRSSFFKIYPGIRRRSILWLNLTYPSHFYSLFHINVYNIYNIINHNQVNVHVNLLIFKRYIKCNQ